jgi:hypothetical protein
MHLEKNSSATLPNVDDGIALKEFLACLAVGGFLNVDQIFDIAEDESTPDNVLQYLVDKGTSLPGFEGWNFSSIAEYTLFQKRLN